MALNTRTTPYGPLEKRVIALEGKVRSLCCGSVPSYNQDEIDALTPTTNIIVFNSTTGTLQFWNGSEWVDAGCGPVEFNEIVSSTHTVTENDGGNKLTTLTDGTGVALTIPNNTTEPIPIGFVVSYEQGGAGAISVTGEMGVTIQGEIKSPAQHTVLELIKKDTNTWLVIGGVS